MAEGLNMKYYKFLFTIVLFFVLPITDAIASPPPAFEGRKLYLSHCMICHGFDGKGPGPLAQKLDIEPEDLPLYVTSHSDSYLARIIAGDDRDKIAKKSGHGDISELMPKWSSVFTTPEVRALVAYLRYLSTTKHKLPGDPELGSSLYKKYCSICHGRDGDGNGALSNLIGLKPIDHTNPQLTDKLDNKTLAKNILEGEGEYMPAWRDILSQDDVNALVSYIRLLYQIWGKLEHGGYVIVLATPTEETDATLTRKLLQNTSCSSSSNLSSAGEARAVKMGTIFKARGISIQKVVSSSHCLASETAKLAFGQYQTAEYLRTDSNLSESRAEANLAEMENLIGSYRGQENLLILTDQLNINELSFDNIESDNFLVLQPMGGSQYEEVGVYKLNY